ncbi:hypothetical protein IJJ12_02465, partial [bacterium]|nr:hypothetical protein [bacterium]
MLYWHARAAFCGRNGGDNKNLTSHQTPANNLHTSLGMVGFLVVMTVAGVCSGPRASRAATR